MRQDHLLLPFLPALLIGLCASRASCQTPSATAAAAAPIEATASVEPVPTRPAFPYLNDDFDRQFQLSNVRSLSGRIAFSATANGYDRIFVLDLNSGRVRKLIDGPGNNSYPTWSPDGKQLVFTSDRDGNKEIYVSTWDGSDQTRITNNDVSDDNPSWFPDGKSLVFTRDSKARGDEQDSNIFAYSFETQRLRALTQFAQRNTTPRISPDGRTLTYSTNRFWPGWDVCFLHIETAHETCPLNGKSNFCRAAWSPSGKLLAYSTGTLDAIDVATLSLESSAKSTLSDMDGKEYDPVWAPSEGLIAFVSDTDVKGNFSLYTVDMQRKIVPLLKSAYSIRYPTWTAAKTFELEASRIRAQELLERMATAVPTVAAIDSVLPPSSTTLSATP